MLDKKKNALLALFLILIAVFILIGLIFIYSSSSVYALEKFGSAHYFVKKQLLGLFLGLAGLLICSRLSITSIINYTPVIFFGSLVLSFLPVITSLGRSIHGSSRWLNIGGLGFQPSEALKMAFILYIAYLLAKKQYRMHSLLYGYIPLLCIVGLTGIVLLKQPDFGQTITLSVTAFMLFFVANCQTKHLVSTFGILIPIASTLIYMKPYRLKRILTFLNPWDDPQGAGFQIIQSLIAIGSGNIAGVGIAQSKQKFFYLPMQHTDFIFSIIAEETGIIGSILLVCLYLLFLYIGLKLALQMTDSFQFYGTMGFVLLTNLQAATNLLVATGLMPTKGLGLPFISYGNSALICNLCMIGLIINFTRTGKKPATY